MYGEQKMKKNLLHMMIGKSLVGERIFREMCDVLILLWLNKEDDLLSPNKYFLGGDSKTECNKHTNKPERFHSTGFQ